MMLTEGGTSEFSKAGDGQHMLRMRPVRRYA